MIGSKQKKNSRKADFAPSPPLATSAKDAKAQRFDQRIGLPLVGRGSRVQTGYIVNECSDTSLTVFKSEGREVFGQGIEISRG